MRGQGAVETASGLLPFGHLGWGYRDRAEFLARACEYLADGVASGQRIEYVGDRGHDALRKELASVPGGADALDAGQACVATPWEFYDVPRGSDVVDPDRAVAARIAGTEKALADGFTGFRAIVDATAVAVTAEQRAAFERFEYLIDRVMTEHPVSALCAYDLGALGRRQAAELLCLHPYVKCGSCQFRLYAEHGAAFGLAGELDVSCESLFAAALDRTQPSPAGGRLVIDGRGLSFAGHRSLLDLDDRLRRRGETGELRTASRCVHRLAGLIDLTHLRVETPV